MQIVDFLKVKTRRLNMKSHLIIIVSGALIGAAAIIPTAIRLRAQGLVNAPQLRRFEAAGFQASATSPLILQGDLLGNNAVWHVTTGPVLSNTFGMIPAVTGFDGAGCQADYSQDKIVTQDGSSLTVNVY